MNTTPFKPGLLHAGLFALLLACGQTHAAEDNPYTQNYQVQNQGNLQSLNATPEPEVFRGTQQEEDKIKMLEDGYDLMGFSTFESQEISPDLAVSHGRAIKADRVLVYVKKGSNLSASSKMEVIKEAAKKGKALTEKDVAADPSKFRYTATYWAKLPPPILGVHVIKLIQRQSGGGEADKATVMQGVRIIAVIHDSAAEKGGLLRGDQLLSINQEKVEDAAKLSSLVRKYRGKLITMQLERDNTPLTLEVQL